MNTHPSFSTFCESTDTESFPDLPSQHFHTIFNTGAAAFRKRRDSVSNSSDTASEASGDSHSSYETSGTSVSVFHENIDTQQWLDLSDHRDLAEQHHESHLNGGLHPQEPHQIAYAQSLHSPLPEYDGSEQQLKQTQHHVHREPHQCSRIDHSLSEIQYDSLPKGHHPRRTSRRTIPSLVRQEDRRRDLVEQLVDAAAQLVATIWPFSLNTNSDCQTSGIHDLRYFVKEVLSRSKTSYNSLQVSLWYLVKVYKSGATDKCHMQNGSPKALGCGRRMLLTSLIVASKYLQDKNFSAKAWSTISGLSTEEIIKNELAFLNAVDHNLHVHDTQEFLPWTNIVMQCAEDIKLRNHTKVQQTWLTVLRGVREGAQLASLQAAIMQLPSSTIIEGNMRSMATPKATSMPLNSVSSSIDVLPAPAGTTIPQLSAASTTRTEQHPGTLRDSDLSAGGPTYLPCPPSPLLDSKLPSPQVVSMASEAPAVSSQMTIENILDLSMHHTDAAKMTPKSCYIAHTRSSLSRTASVRSASDELRLQNLVDATDCSSMPSLSSPGLSSESSFASSSLTENHFSAARCRDTSLMELTDYDAAGPEISLDDEDLCVDRFEHEQDALETKRMKQRHTRSSNGTRLHDESALTDTPKRKRRQRHQAESRRLAKALKRARKASSSPTWSADPSY